MIPIRIRLFSFHQQDWVIPPESGKTEVKIDLHTLLSYDPIASDRRLGICPVALYEFEGQDFERVLASSSVEETASILKRYDIYQYFFPAPDSIAVGVIDHGIKEREKITEHVESAPTLGHPFGEMELLEKEASLLTIIDHLQERKLVVEGEFGIELTADGMKTRSSVKFKPKESIISKIVNQLSMRIDLKSLFHIGEH